MEVEPAGVPRDGPADERVWNKEHLVFVWSIVLGSIAGGFSIVGLVIWLVLRHEKKRTENLASIALELGLTFSPTEDEELLSKLLGIPLFQQGRSRRMKNVMSAATDANQLTMFDYSYTTGGGKTVRTHHYTMFVMESSVEHFDLFQREVAHSMVS